MCKPKLNTFIARTSTKSSLSKSESVGILPLIFTFPSNLQTVHTKPSSTSFMYIIFAWGIRFISEMTHWKKHLATGLGPDDANDSKSKQHTQSTSQTWKRKVRYLVSPSLFSENPQEILAKRTKAIQALTSSTAKIVPCAWCHKTDEENKYHKETCKTMNLYDVLNLRLHIKTWKKEALITAIMSCCKYPSAKWTT